VVRGARRRLPPTPRAAPHMGAPLASLIDRVPDHIPTLCTLQTLIPITLDTPMPPPLLCSLASAPCSASGATTRRSSALAAHRRPHLPEAAARTTEASSTPYQQQALAAAAAATAVALLAASGAPTPALAAAASATSTITDPAVERAAASIADAFEEKQYYVTGALPPGLFADDCVFVDPTTRVQGAQRYADVVASLFDGAQSRADLLSIGPGPEPRTVLLRWRLEGRLALPGNPPVKAYTGSTLYRLSGSSEAAAAAATAAAAAAAEAPGALRVVEQIETWDISAFDAFASSFLPGWLWQGAPPAPPVEVLLREQKQQQQLQQ
jgi:hypothetical protein